MIKQLSLTDWQIYKLIRLECIKNTPWAFSTRYNEEVQKSDQHWQEVINNPLRKIFGIFDNDQIIAMAGLALPEQTSPYTSNQILSMNITVNACKIQSEKYFVISVYCKPEYRGQGYIDKLLLFIINFHQAKTSHNLYLAVEKNNTPAISLYKKFGFCIVNNLSARVMGDGLLHEELLMELKHV